MKKFLKNTALFFLPVLLMAYPLDLALSYFLSLHPQYTSGEVAIWKDVISGNVQSEVVIYGSSRAWVHIDPSLIQEATGHSAYNLGADGQYFVIQHLRHEKLLEHNQVPSVILYSLDPHTLSVSDEFYQYEQLLPFMLFDETMEKHAAHYELFSTADYYIPMKRYFGNAYALKEALKQARGMNGKPDRTRGFAGNESEWNLDFSRAREEFGSIRIELDPHEVAEFKEFIKDCQQQEIELVLIYSPIHQYGQSFVENYDEIVNLYAGLAEENDLLFLDYSNHPICTDTTLFYNASHLNARGARKFTELLIEDLGERGVF